MELKEFTEDLRKKINEFEQAWIIKNSNDPAGFPLKIENDNSGVWFEMFSCFLDEGKL